MSRKNDWQDVYLFQFGSIRRIRAYPTRQNTKWRDELGCEYPNRMIRQQLTYPKHIALFEQCERDRQYERTAVQHMIHPENYKED